MLGYWLLLMRTEYVQVVQQCCAINCKSSFSDTVGDNTDTSNKAGTLVAVCRQKEMMMGPGSTFLLLGRK